MSSWVSRSPAQVQYLRVVGDCGLDAAATA
jgi:hypothetical protein